MAAVRIPIGTTIWFVLALTLLLLSGVLYFFDVNKLVVFVIFIASAIQAAACFVLYKDMRARRLAEEERDRFFTLSPDLLCVAGFDGFFKQVNPAFCAVLGYSAEELLRQPFMEFVHPDDHTATEAKADRLEGGSSVSRFENRYRCKDGTLRWLSWKAVSDVATSRIYASARDVTERKCMEEALRKSEQHLAITLDSIGDGVFVTDFEGRVTRLNPAAEKFTGWTSDQAQGRPFKDVFQLIHEDTRQPVGNPIENVLTTGQVLGLSNHAILISRDGTERPVSDSCAPICDKDGRVVGAVLVFRDVSAERRAELELIRSRQAAEAANIAKSAFLASMSHEIRTPMNGIIGLAFLLKQTPLMLKQADYLTKIDTSARNLLHIINDILDFSKVEAGKIELEKIEFNLDEVYANLTQLVTLQIKQKELAFRIDVAPSVPQRLVGDPFRLGQVLLNLAGNAVKFTERGEVVVNVEVLDHKDHGMKLRFAVRDTGVGLSDEQMKHIFEPFYQANAGTTRCYGGTGLGLAISMRFVQMMGGALEIQSAPGKGTTFRFTACFDRPEGDSKRCQAIRMSLAGKRALVADNDVSSRIALMNLLKQLSLDAVCVESGEDALDRIQRIREKGAQPFDLILVDFCLPGIDCAETARRIRGETLFGAAPAIVLVYSRELDTFTDDVEQAGFDALLAKPVTRSALFDAVMHALEHSSSATDSADPSNFDLPKMDAILNGAKILLVEDNEINQLIAEELLKLAGCEVVIASNGLEALSILFDSRRAGEFDAVLMDLQMPDMDGYEATARIRAEKRLDSLPILAMTADAVSGIKEECMAAGMDDYLTKPIKLGELFSTLAKWVAKHRGALSQA